MKTDRAETLIATIATVSPPVPMLGSITCKRLAHSVSAINYLNLLNKVFTFYGSNLARQDRLVFNEHFHIRFEDDVHCCGLVGHQTTTLRRHFENGV